MIKLIYTMEDSKVHLKGDKEFKAEELYNLLEEKYICNFNKYSEYMRNIDINNVKDIMKENKIQVIMYDILTEIYGMDLSEKEIDILINTIKKCDLLRSIAESKQNFEDISIIQYIRIFIANIESIKLIENK